jgi:hypothetical protein
MSAMCERDPAGSFSHRYDLERRGQVYLVLVSVLALVVSPPSLAPLALRRQH